jgi:deoxyribodipyrimidine photolyase-related protein
MEVCIIFPHQLFEQNPALLPNDRVYLVEEYLFFNQYIFHKQKLAYHRATMCFYADFLEKQGFQVHYIDAQNALCDVRLLLAHLADEGVQKVRMTEVVDDWLGKRIAKTCLLHHIALQIYATPCFLSTEADIAQYYKGKKRYFQTDFYVYERKRRQVLLDADQKPTGGKWTFDAENRLKYPKNKIPPHVALPAPNAYTTEAIAYVHQYYPQNYGTLSQVYYPVTFQESKVWLQDFIQKRLQEFGDYEDAIVGKEHFLHHSILTPMLNVGLLTPQEIITEILSHTHLPINSVEGFVRQVMGWREFIRAVYVREGGKERTTNFWNFQRKIPASFWVGKTGILPVDTVIQKILQTGYCHHIERLMVVGNFMLLCEFSPDEVYRWFMELFIDAYDWVMVPNVYGMSQFADGGLMATKPYISGSNYLLKMSDFPKGAWQETWDALFWRFMHTHRDFFTQNPRLGMLIKSFDKMPEAKQKAYLQKAEAFLETLDKT